MLDNNGVATETFWEELRSRIFALALKLTGNRFEADDLTQEAVIRIQENLMLFRGESQLFTWVYKVVLNLYRDNCRTMSRLYTMPLDKIRVLQVQIDFADFIDLMQVLNRMPRLQRNILLLRDYYGYSYQEIATFYHCSLDSVRSRLYRARQILRLELCE